MKEYKCRVCGIELDKDNARVKQKNYICNDCNNKAKRASNEKRISEGKGSYKFEYRNKEARKEYVRNYTRGYRAKMKDPELAYKKTTRRLVYMAVQAGKLTKGVCEVCGEVKVEGHHTDYNKPLDVMWLCKKHHTEWHRFNKAIY